jgi:hypothetical protein
MKYQKMIKTKYTISVYLIFSVILLYTCPTFGLEALSEEQLDVITGQAGITVLMTSLLIEHEQDEFTFRDTLGGDIAYKDLSFSLELSTKTQGINLDIAQLQGLTTIELSMHDMGTDFDFFADDVVFNDKSIGSIEIDTLQVPELDLILYANSGAGIDMGLGVQLEVDKFEYTYDSGSSLTMTGIMAANSFDGDSLPSFGSTVGTGASIDTSTWDAQNTFLIGDAKKQEAFTIDIVDDTSPYIKRTWNIDENGTYSADSDGYIGTGESTSEPWIANSRAANYGAYIEMSGPIDGSFRIKDVSYEDGSTGPVAIDGIDGKGSYLYIEVPGRGYGNSWDLPYYDNDN